MPTHAPPVLRPAQRAQIANDLRLACMRISRRVRYEGAGSLAPHQFSVLARIDEQPRTPGELADLERVSAPSMTRTVASLVAGGWVDRRTAGRSTSPSPPRAGSSSPTRAAAATRGWRCDSPA